jgi:hypothetical protein
MMGVVVSLVVAVAGLSGPSAIPIICRPTPDALVIRDPDKRVQADLDQTMCAARERMDALTHLRDTDISKLALEVAVAPTFEVLDQVSRLPSPRWRLVAQRLRGDLYVEMSMRLRHAPPASADVDDGAAVIDDGESAARVADWLAGARAAYADVRTIAASHPELTAER